MERDSHMVLTETHSQNEAPSLPEAHSRREAHSLKFKRRELKLTHVRIIVAFFTVLEKFADVVIGWLPLYG
ncbi:putative HVA22 protein g [Trifolium repens]|nr:putative HVA22 protein g [Trifolium repens]